MSAAAAAPAAAGGWNPLLDGIISTGDLEAKKRSPLPMPAPPLLLDALQPLEEIVGVPPRLSAKFAVTVFIALRASHGVPLEVLNSILCFCIHPTPCFSPYIAPTSSKKYTSATELRAVREHGLCAIHEHNACFTGVSPYSLRDGEAFGVRGLVRHSGGIGLVSQRFDGATSNLRFCPEAFVYYVGIELLHSNNPEYKIPFSALQDSRAMWLSVHEWRPLPGQRATRRYAALWSASDVDKRPAFVFWLPDSVFGVRQDSGRMEPVYPAAQVWNRGDANVVRVLRTITKVPAPPAADASFYPPPAGV